MTTSKTKPFPQFGCAIDWETSGYSWPNYAEKHQGISFGAIIFDMRSFEPVEELYQVIKFDPKYEWNFGAEKVHGLTREYLAANGVTQEEAAAELLNLIVKYFGSNPEPILLGHRVHFDRAFTNQLTSSLEINVPWNATVIDSNSIGTVFLEIERSEELFTTLGMPARKEHNAMEDIRYTLASVKRMKEYFLAGLAATL